MANAFDQFDTAAAPKGNPFDQFDATKANPADTGEGYGMSEFPSGPMADEIIHASPIGHVLSAFGQGMKDGWGAGTVGIEPGGEAEKYLRESGVFPSLDKGRNDILKSFNEAIIRPAAAGFDAAMRGTSALFKGAQEVVVQAGEEVGAPNLARDIAAMPEAFFGSPGGLGKTRIDYHNAQVSSFLAEARSLSVIGDGEAGWLGTNRTIPSDKEQAAAQRDWISAYDEANPDRPAPSLAQDVAPAVAEEPRDVHQIARDMAPDTFREYDALGMRQETFRRWLTELDETRRNELPETAQINDLEAKIADEGTTNRLRKKYQDRLDELTEARDSKLGEDTPTMARVRKALQDTDYKMRDLSPEVSKAYREAEPFVEEAKPVEAPKAEEPAPFNEAGTLAETAREPATTEAPEAKPLPSRTTPEHVANIAADMERRLTEVGRSAEEAKATAAIIASHYEARAERFNGEKGNAQALYERDRPEIRRSEKGGKSGAGSGKTTFWPDRTVITLFDKADASTFIHETGHHWLEELMKDAKDNLATDATKAEADKVLKWLGVEKAEDIKTRHHEKFARGFEQYMREGVAPTQALANVFAQFKDWLTKIYDTAKKLGRPIDDDIRKVFDRMISTGKEPPVIAEERPAIEAPKEKRAETLEAAERGEPAGASVADTAAPATPLAPDERPPLPSQATPQPPSPHASFEQSSPLIDKAGNIRLDNLNAPEDIKEVLRQSAMQNEGFARQRRGRISDAEVLDLADALGMDPTTLSQRKIGQAFNAEEIKAAEKLLVQSSAAVLDASKKAASGTDADVMAYAAAKERHAMIQGQFSGITAEAGRALRALQKGEELSQAIGVSEFLRQSTGKTLFQLREEANRLAGLDTAQKVSKFINDSRKATYSEMAQEIWINALLSGPMTHLKNIAGNTFVAINSIVEEALTASYGKIRQVAGSESDRVTFGDVRARMYGTLQGAQEGVALGLDAFKHPEKYADQNKVEQKKFGAVPGAAGTAVRLPSRALGAEDELFKAIAYRQTLNQLAHFQAETVEGLEGEAIARRAAEIAANPSPEMIEAGRKAERYQTFTTELGPTGRAVQQFANSNIATKFTIPFVRVPVNMGKYSVIERTPLGLFTQEVRSNLSGRNGSIARDRQLARLTIGAAVGATMVNLVAQSLATGSGTGDPRQDALKRMEGWRQDSIRLGDSYVGYNWMPLGMLAGISADAYQVGHALSTGETDHLAKLISASVMTNLVNQTWMSGPSNLVRAVTDPERYGENYAKQIFGSFVPSSVAQAAQFEDPYLREARTIIDGVKARIPFASESLLPRRDVFGDMMLRDVPAHHDVIVDELQTLKVFPAKAERKIRGVELTDQQYDDYARISGRFMKMQLEGLIQQPGWSNYPEFVRREIVTKTISGAREAGRTTIMMQNPEIIQKAVEIKKEAMRKGGVAVE